MSADTAPAAMPSAEQIARYIIGPRKPVPADSLFSLAALQEVRWKDIATDAERLDAISAASAILSLFDPILAEKEREIAAALGLIEGHSVVIAGLESRALAAEAALAKAVVFELGEHHYVESRGDGTWAIKNGGCVLNIDGEWEWEPSPSNRKDEFIARTRFDRDDAFRRAAAIRAQGE